MWIIQNDKFHSRYCYLDIRHNDELIKWWLNLTKRGSLASAVDQKQLGWFKGDSLSSYFSTNT